MLSVDSSLNKFFTYIILRQVPMLILVYYLPNMDYFKFTGAICMSSLIKQTTIFVSTKC